MGTSICFTSPGLPLTMKTIILLMLVGCALSKSIESSNQASEGVCDADKLAACLGALGDAIAKCGEAVQTPDDKCKIAACVFYSLSSPAACWPCFCEALSKFNYYCRDCERTCEPTPTIDSCCEEDDDVFYDCEEPPTPTWGPTPSEGPKIIRM